MQVALRSARPERIHMGVRKYPPAFSGGWRCICELGRVLRYFAHERLTRMPGGRYAQRFTLGDLGNSRESES